MRESLLHWFDTHARAFPWRSATPRRPYEVLVAEVLLQQTQAQRVAQAYPRFLRRFPDVSSLALATADEVLAQWQGLGYYQRALRLRQAARTIMERHHGAVPDDLDALRALPGVGRYSANAIAAQAFGRATIAVDANVRRVGARLLGLHEARLDDVEAALGERLLAPGGPAAARRHHLGEALIELGATVCRPRAPACHACPLRSGCVAAAGDPTAFPARAAARRPRHEQLRLLVARRGDSVALCRRPERGRWGGLWGFPALGDGGEALAGRPLAGFEHVLSHRALLVRPLQVRAERAPEGATWLALTAVAAGGGDHPVAVLDQRLAERLLRSAPPRDRSAP